MINFVDYYFERMEHYKKLRKGKGYTQEDMHKAQLDVKQMLKEGK